MSRTINLKNDFKQRYLTVRFPHTERHKFSKLQHTSHQLVKSE